MKEIREMTMEEVSARLAEISEELKNDTADLDALNEEINNLEERKKEIKNRQRKKTVFFKK